MNITCKIKCVNCNNVSKYCDDCFKKELDDKLNKKHIDKLKRREYDRKYYLQKKIYNKTKKENNDIDYIDIKEGKFILEI